MFVPKLQALAKFCASQCIHTMADKQMNALQLTSSLLCREDGTQTGSYHWDPGLLSYATWQESSLLLSSILTNW